MKIKALRQDLVNYISVHKLVRKWEKASKLLENDIRHPSLNTELLEPKWHGIYSFRLDKKYRALFFFVKRDVIEVFQITNHYK